MRESSSVIVFTYIYVYGVTLCTIKHKTCYHKLTIATANCESTHDKYMLF